jgi:hypothetical protein
MVPLEHVEFADSVRAAQEVFSDLTHETVVWDEEFEHPISYRGGLLEQLAEGGQFMGSEEITMEVSLSPPKLIPGDGSSALFSPEVARYADQLVLDEMPSAKVVWDDVMSGDCGLWHGLLEELQQCDHYSVDERTKPVIKHDVDVKRLHVASDEISRKVQWDDEQLPDQVADTSLVQQIAMGKGYPEGVVFSHADGHDADQMFDKASKHGIIEQTHSVLFSWSLSMIQCMRMPLHLRKHKQFQFQTSEVCPWFH